MKRVLLAAFATVMVAGCGLIRVPVPGEVPFRVGPPTGQTDSVPVQNGGVDRRIGVPVTMDRGAPVVMDRGAPVSLDSLGIGNGRWSLKGSKITTGAASMTKLSGSATSRTLELNGTVKMRFIQNDADAAQGCVGTQTYTIFENEQASATVDADGNISELSGQMSEANLVNLWNAVKVLDAKYKEAQAGTPWKLMVCLNATVKLDGVPVPSGTFTLSGFDFALGLYFKI